MNNLVEYYPDKQVGGIRGWYWIKTDSGAWDGPAKDWENHHLAKIQTLVKNKGTAIQAGGNLGMYPRLLSHLFKRVYTFEPDPLNFYTLDMNTYSHENIVKFQAAVGYEKGMCVVNRLTMSNVGMHKIETAVDQKLAMIPIVRIDDFNIDDVGLIMLDTEGYEYQALLGATNTIERCRPVIFAERPTEQLHALMKLLRYQPMGLSAMDGVYIPE